jgi:hypothetical protein
MDRSKKGREVCNILEYSDGMVICFDQYSQRIEEYFGPKVEILPKLKQVDLSRAKIKRKMSDRAGQRGSWVSVSAGKFLEETR